MNNDLGLPPFYVGQKVVCIRPNIENLPSMGQVLTVHEITKSKCPCDMWIVSFLNILGYGNGTICLDCYTYLSNGGPLYFYSNRFVPLLENFTAITFKEVIEIEQPLISVQ